MANENNILSRPKDLDVGGGISNVSAIRDASVLGRTFDYDPD